MEISKLKELREKMLHEKSGFDFEDYRIVTDTYKGIVAAFGVYLYSNCHRNGVRNILNATNWEELKKQLRQLQGRAIFKLERINSMDDGAFYRVLHQVKSHELVFFDGRQSVYLHVDAGTESKIEYFENGFRVGNCTYILEKIMEV